MPAQPMSTPHQPPATSPAGDHAPARLPGDLLVRAGALLFFLGVLLIIATVAPMALGTARLPRLFYLLCLLAPIGLGVSLTGLLVQARAGRRPR